MKEQEKKEKMSLFCTEELSLTTMVIDAFIHKCSHTQGYLHYQLCVCNHQNGMRSKGQTVISHMVTL